MNMNYVMNLRCFDKKVCGKERSPNRLETLKFDKLQSTGGWGVGKL